MAKSGFIILDRDGVINKMVVDPDHGTIDSPLHSSQVEICHGVHEALQLLTQAGFDFAIATNQPAAAKGKTTIENLNSVHRLILDRIEIEGINILSSHICLHRAEDNCECRKPKPGLLRAALEQHHADLRQQCWMVGDGVTDVQAGAALGLRTAFLGPTKWDAKSIFENLGLKPSFWGKDLLSFAQYLVKQGRSI